MINVWIEEYLRYHNLDEQALDLLEDGPDSSPPVGERWERHGVRCQTF